MDSLPEQVRGSLKETKFISYPREKDETDLELALVYAKERGASDIVVVAATGDRLEYTVANVLILANQNLGSNGVEIWQGEQTARLIRPPGNDIPGKPGDIVSLLPLGNDVSGITTTGLAYPLCGENLSFGAARGISNIIREQPASVKLAAGLLLAVYTPGEPVSKPGKMTHPEKTMNVAVQVLPLVENAYPVVDKAIAAIQASGVKYEVGPLETTLEGDDLDRLLEVAKSAHRASLEAGANTVTIIKIAESITGSSIEEKVKKYRKTCP
jgi:thiamine pyrophosphokinase